MTAVDQRSSVATWNEPATVAARGTLILLPGRGEHPGLYERFGRRISSDAYRVRVVSDPVLDEVEAQRQVHAVLAEVAAEAERSGTAPTPVVLVGSDAGALYATALAAGGDLNLDALILAGVALPSTPTGDVRADQFATDWNDEVELRTACSAHQTRLRNDGDVRRGAIFAPVPSSWLDRARLSSVRVPVLALHGQTDEISPIDAARRFYGEAASVEAHAVQGGRHDVLNDQTHRSVAATIVLFLERLRLQIVTGGAANEAPSEIVTRLATS